MHIYHMLRAFPLFSQTLPLFLFCFYVRAASSPLDFVKQSQHQSKALGAQRVLRTIDMYIEHCVYLLWLVSWLLFLDTGSKRGKTIVYTPFSHLSPAVVWLHPKWVIRGKPNELKKRINTNVYKRFSCII